MGWKMFGSGRYRDAAQRLAGIFNGKVAAFGDESREYFAVINRMEERVFREMSAEDLASIRSVAAGWTLDHVSTMVMSFNYLSGSNLKTFAESLCQSLIGYGNPVFWDSFERSGAERIKLFDARGFQAMSVAEPFGKRVMARFVASPGLEDFFTGEYGVFCAIYLVSIWGFTANEFSDSRSVEMFANQFSELLAKYEEYEIRREEILDGAGDMDS